MAKKKSLLGRISASIRKLFGKEKPKKQRRRRSSKKTTTSKKSSSTPKAKVQYKAPSTRVLLLEGDVHTSKRKKPTRAKRKTDWAHTKEVPHKNHPAYFKKKGGDNIEYVTFTHSNSVDFDKDSNKPLEEHDIVETRQLQVNIDKTKKGSDEKSHVVPRVYIGTRSSLGKGTNKFELSELDEPLIDEIFKTAPRYPIPKTSNSKQKKNTPQE